MSVSFASTTEQTNALYKFPESFSWDSLPAFDCFFKEPFDDYEPTIVVDMSNNSTAGITGTNYCRIGDLAGPYGYKFYWIKDRVYLGKNRIEFHLKVDPLYTYRRAIEFTEGVVERVGGVQDTLPDTELLERFDDGTLISIAGRNFQSMSDYFEKDGGYYEDDFTDGGPADGTNILGVVRSGDPNNPGSVGMTSYYQPTGIQLQRFGEWLTSYNLDHLSDFWKFFNNPIESVVSLRKVFCSVKYNGEPYIMFGNGINEINTYVTARNISDRTTQIIFRGYHIREVSNNYRAYAPYTTAKLYLPFIGFIPFNPATIYTGDGGDQIKVKYDIDVITGALLAEVSTVDASSHFASVPIGYYTGNCGVDCPITGNNGGLVLGNIASSLIKTAVGAYTGSIGLTTAGLGQLAGTSFENEVQGTVTGNAGAYGPKRPFVVIETSPYFKADHSIEHIGTAYNQTYQVQHCKNFVKFKDIGKIDYSFYSPYPTLREMEEIETLLKTGVVLPENTRFIN